MKEFVNSLIAKLENRTPALVKVGLATVGLIALAVVLTPAPNDITASSVMILSANERSGGTGVVLSSSKGQTTIITNAHVCGVVARGGLVQAKGINYIVSSYKKSQIHDLCLLTINANLKTATKIASRPPVAYTERAVVSGHPALYPNTVTSGHFSGSRILPIMTGIKKCTGKESGQDALFCALFGVAPIVKVYEANLVTATIMAGSSGSGVYNSDNELSGLVFAGSQGLSYAWTVPYDALVDFVSREARTLKEVKLGAFVLGDNEDESETAKFRFKVGKACSEEKTREKLGTFCRTLVDDAIWRQQ